MEKADGPCPVVAATDNTVTILCDGMTETISRDCVAKAPPPRQPPPSDAQGANRTQLTQPKAPKHALGRIYNPRRRPRL